MRGEALKQNRIYAVTEKSEQYERLEYLLRQDRRRALVTELLELMQGNKSGGE